MNQCHGNQLPYLVKGTIPEPSTSHIGKGGGAGRSDNGFRVHICQNLSDSTQLPRNNQRLNPAQDKAFWTTWAFGRAPQEANDMVVECNDSVFTVFV
jgi:hypothetical protein